MAVSGSGRARGFRGKSASNSFAFPRVVLRRCRCVSSTSRRHCGLQLQKKQASARPPRCRPRMPSPFLARPINSRLLEQEIADLVQIAKAITHYIRSRRRGVRWTARRSRKNGSGNSIAFRPRVCSSSTISDLLLNKWRSVRRYPTSISEKRIPVPD